MEGDLAGARRYYEQALAIRERVLGTEHPDTAQSLNNLGAVLRAQGDLAGARRYFERALAIREQVFGAEHPDTAQSIWWMGTLLAASGDHNGARTHIQCAVAIYNQTLGASHPTTQQCQRALDALDAPRQTREQQIAEIEQQAQAKVEQALAEGTAEERATLIERLEVAATAYAAGQVEGSPYLALAERLRGLAARLRGEE